MKYKAYGDCVILKRPKDNAKTTKTGIFIPSREEEKRVEDRVQLQRATVFDVGPKVKDKIKVGDSVVYNAYDAWDTEDGEIIYTMLKAKDVQAIEK